MKALFCLLALLRFSYAMEAASLPLQGEDPYLAFADTMPEPIGGMQAIYAKIKYPDFARISGIEGKVYALAFINESGGVDEVKIIKGLEDNCNKEVINAVLKSKFTPGILAGKPAKVKLTIRIEFRLT